MRYRSTSREAPLTSLRGAVLRGLAPDGGLYMPAEIARHTAEELEEFRRLPFTEVCFRVVKPFATPDVPEEVLWQVVSEAINFPVNLISLSPGLHILELFHGPTLAFKDFGARFMARLMGYFVRGETRPLTVLVATSGDTGSAVAHGFLGVPGIRVVILYPSKRISEAQEKQFTTLGENITSLEVAGTFDDCQRLVKQAFCDSELNKRAFLTSANSINIGRLLPQILESYWTHGFYVFQGVVGPEELQELRADIDTVLSRAPVAPDATVDRHGRPASTEGIIKPPYRWAKPLSDPVGGTDKNNGRHPAAMLQPEPGEDAPAWTVET